MTTDLQQILADRPNAVKAIDERYGDEEWRWKSVDEDVTANTIRSYCHTNSIARPWLDSIESLLTAIEAKLKAERGLTDAEIEGMKWKAEGRGVMHNEIVGSQIVCLDDEEANDAVAAQHACVDRLWQDIRRLRAKCGEVKQ